jgi:hypothetical protein
MLESLLNSTWRIGTAIRRQRTLRQRITATVKEIRTLVAVRDRKLGDRLLRETVRMLANGTIEVTR